MAYTTINDPTQYFNTVLYTGNNVDDRSITGVGFQPDWMWSKERNSTGNHFLVDSTRGATKVLQGNLTNDEATVADGFQAFESDGFQVGAANSTNETGVNYVNWCWLANGGTTSSNTDGDITSTVQVNSTSKFSIFTYTGNGNNLDTVGHGLGTTPDFCVIKGRSSGASGTQRWFVKVPAVCGASEILELDTTSPKSDSGNGIETMSSTTVTLGIDTGNTNGINESGLNYVGYAFASVKGYSKIGKYIGNGSTDGQFVYTGFKPAWLMVKRTDSAGENWTMFDNKRDGYNVNNDMLKANVSETEDAAGNFFDLLSNGFKVRESAARHNASGGTYIYMAFAENPLVGTNGIPATAR